MTSVYRGNTTSEYAPFKSEFCKASVSDGGRWPKYHQCRRKPWRDGWCKQHHPETEAKQREQKLQRWERETELRLRPQKELEAAKARIRELEAQRDELAELCRKAEQLASVASDWWFQDVEIDGELVSVHSLVHEFHTAIAKVST